MTIVLIPCGATEWHAEGRLLGRVELPLSGDGAAQCSGWAERLRLLGLTRIYHSPDELAGQTARRLARALGIRTRTIAELAEVDVGLWAGLTEEQIQNRFETTHRELCEKPLNVQPPQGESFEAAMERIRAFLRKQLKRGQPGALGLVLRPLVFAMARCLLEGRSFCEALQAAKNAREPVTIEAAAVPDGANGRPRSD
jgi:broad specificity phosphatase PhoE